MLIIPPQLIQFSSIQKIGVLLVGHGTRSIEGQTEFKHLFEQFKQFLSPIPCEMAFLELASPTIEEAINSLASTGIAKVLTVPALLFTAGHAELDIPQAVEASLSKRGLTSVGQTNALECSDEVLELSAIRFREAVCDEQCRGRCCGEFCSRAGWVMVGRGSSSPTATAKTRQFGERRWELTPTAHHQVAFIHGQHPTVEQALDQLATIGHSIAVVQPHLLFSGLLMEQLTAQVTAWQQQNPGQRWILAPSLGADHRLAELLARQAIELIGSIQP